MQLQKGTKRLLAVLMIASAPISYSEPISIHQESMQILPPAIQVRDTPRLKKAVLRSVRKTAKKVTVKKPRTSARRTPSVVKKGIASWYSKTDPFINRHTANGEVFDDRKLTCASWHHPFGTKLKVTNLQNGKSVVCRVNDRGPNKRLKREIDLTIGAFKRIAAPNRGLIRVSVTKLKN